MKVAVVFLTFVVCALAYPAHHDGTEHDDPETKEMLKKIHEYSKQCVEETGISEETSKNLVNGVFTVRDEPAQCYVKCLFKKTGLMNEEGTPQKDKLLEKLKKKKVDVESIEELAEKCIAEKGANECETAFKIYECYRGHVKYTHEFKEEKKEEKTEETKTVKKEEAAEETPEKPEEKVEEKKSETIEEKKLEVTEETKTEKKTETTEEIKEETKTTPEEDKKPEVTEEKKVEKTEEKKDE